MEKSLEVDMQRRLRVVIVGSGNVAESFAHAVSGCAEIELVGLYARNRERGMAIAESCATQWYGELRSLPEADIYLIAVSDRAVADVAESLLLPSEAIVVHTAGSIPLAALPERGGRRGIIYPLQSFSAGRKVDFGCVPLFVEADSELVREELFRFARLLSRSVEYADSERRRVLHLAGVVVNNFVNALYAEGAAIVESEGLSFDVLKPLIVETAAKASSVENPRRVQTGPAVRGDKDVCRRHMAMLRGDEKLEKIYSDLTERIWETSRKI